MQVIIVVCIVGTIIVSSKVETVMKIIDLGVQSGLGAVREDWYWYSMLT